MANYAAGKYLVELTGQQGFSETSTGNPQFFMKFLVQYRWDFSAGDWVECEVAERTWYRVITDKTAQYAAEDFRALGFNGDKFSQLDARHPQKHVFGGQIEMTLAVEQYNNKPSEKWNVVRGGGGREEKIIDPTAAKKLDMLFGKALAAVPKTGFGYDPAVQAQPAAVPARPPAGRPPALVSQPRNQPPNKPGHGTTDQQPEPPRDSPTAPSGLAIDDSDLPF